MAKAVRAKKIREKSELKKFPKSSFIYVPTTLALVLGTIILALVVSLVALRLLFSDRIYPGIFVAQTDLGGLTKKQALEKLNNRLAATAARKMTFNYSDPSGGSQTVEFDLTNLSRDLNSTQAVDQVFELGHSRIYLPPVNLSLTFNQNLNSELKTLTDQINKEPIDSEIKVAGADINVTPSQDGYVLDKNQFQKQLLQLINSGKLDSHNLPMIKTRPHLDFATASQIKKRLDSIKTAPLSLSFKESSASAQKQIFNLNFDTLVSLLDLQQNDYLSPAQTQNYLRTISKEIDRPVQEPLFNFDPNSPSKISQFSPPVTGKQLNLEKTKMILAQALIDENIKEIILPVETISPKNKLTNDLGIRELIGQGKSSFEGSINNRIYNLKLATTRLNGVLVSPGETFSFLGTLGKIDASTGYKQAYVIKSGKTVLDDGGGVCQVSTTLFRAVLNSGLPVLERTAHAYRVSYYELGGYPPGLDATVFDPGVDFKFKNDTPSSILIQAYTDERNNLYVNFYGSSDGRTAEISKPVITNRASPPPELRQDDPNLPKGTIQQTEHAIEGANVVFSRKVTRNGQVLIDESFKSNFRPWQAVYLVGTKES